MLLRRWLPPLAGLILLCGTAQAHTPVLGPPDDADWARRQGQLPANKAYQLPVAHTGVYINTPDVVALQADILTPHEGDYNNRLGWYTAWPMLVDYRSGAMAQIGYLTSPAQQILQPTLYVAWSRGGADGIHVRYLPHQKAVGNAGPPGALHRYELALSPQGEVDIRIDGKAFLTAPNERLRLPIHQGTGEFMSEVSNLGMEMRTRFRRVAYKRRGDTDWQPLFSQPRLLLFNLALGSRLTPTSEEGFEISGQPEAINHFRQCLADAQGAPDCRGVGLQRLP